MQKPVKWEVKDGVGYHQHQHLLAKRPARTRATAIAGDRQAARPSIRSAMSSTCATMAAACSTRRSRSPTSSSTIGEIVSQRGREKTRYRALLRRIDVPGDLAHGLPVVVLTNAGHRLRLGDRRRRAAGSSPRAGHGRAQLRQGIGPDAAADSGRQHRAAPDHRALLHAVGPLGAGRRDRARHRRAAALATPITRSARCSARPICAAT